MTTPLDIPPYSLIMIKPLTVGRKQAPAILEYILQLCPVSLRFFREWEICPTTWRALYDDKDIADVNILTSLPGIGRKAWVGLFTHKDRVSDPYPHLIDISGINDTSNLNNSSIRSIWRTRTTTPHGSDTVIHISDPKRVKLEADLLLYNFREVDV
jgi:hypothetical protein